MTSFRGSTPLVFLSERQAMAVDILESICSSSSRPCFYKIMRRLRFLEFHLYVSDSGLGSGRCG